MCPEELSCVHESYPVSRRSALYPRRHFQTSQKRFQGSKGFSIAIFSVSEAEEELGSGCS
ncbi:unnamed protein product, partial [Citrullus colocynthis]